MRNGELRIEFYIFIRIVAVSYRSRRKGIPAHEILSGNRILDVDIPSMRLQHGGITPLSLTVEGKGV